MVFYRCDSVQIRVVMAAYWPCGDNDYSGLEIADLYNLAITAVEEVGLGRQNGCTGLHSCWLQATFHLRFENL